MTPNQARGRSAGIIAALVALLAAGAIAWYLTSRRAGGPAIPPETYAEVVRHFYRGLAQLQVGLIDASKEEFRRVNVLAPEEPAGWANLALAELRLGEFDAAAPHIERAATLAPTHAAIVFVRGRLEMARGRPDAGLPYLRKAADLDPADPKLRMALILAVQDAGGPDADAEAARLLDQLLEQQPDNLAVLVERARVAAKRADGAALAAAMTRLTAASGGWPPDVLDQFQEMRRASEAGRFPDAARELASLRNVLAQVPAFLEQRRLVTPAVELVAEPLTAFVRLPLPSPALPPADNALVFAPAFAGSAPATAVQTVWLDDARSPALFAAEGPELRWLGGAGPALRWSSDAAASAAPIAVLPLDWNHDFATDLIVASTRGVRLFLQGAGGTFTDATVRASQRSGALDVETTGAWAADIEMDGDVDVVVGVRGAPPAVLRNNGDGTWQVTKPFASGSGVRAFVWGDIDSDGDPDAAFVDERGGLHVWANLQSSQFRAIVAPAESAAVRALALGDLDADNVFDLVTVNDAGAIRRASFAQDRWHEEAIATWRPRSGGAESSRLWLADLDNNGALDVLASDEAGTAVWLTGADRRLQPLGATIDAEIFSVADLDGDGQLDLAGLAAGRPVRLHGKSARGYHFVTVRPRAQRTAGDQRVNTFGIGGEVTVRSGSLVQRQVIAGPVVHVGLGASAAVDVVRLVWPNGVPQAEFDAAIDKPIVAEQRLKGSCPWVFADDGRGMQFVTDFLWRSPLGLRINAQDTAGVLQTEDWVKIRGDQLAARNGAYDIRITAELWETHFVDHVSLLAVDHPKDVDVFVDERFAREAPVLAVRAMRPPVAVAQAWDEAGRDVTATVAARDGRHLSTFALGPYQGVAADHFVEVALGGAVPESGPVWLVAQGWIYPTDSSINVAIGQGGRVKPRGLSLEAQDAHGQWVMVAPDLGFPEGKNKTILIDLAMLDRAGVRNARRLRLATNLEIYWDFIGWAAGVDASAVKMTRLDAASAELRYRGYSTTVRDARDQPEVPVYDRLENVTPRWRDLIGFYTRFGDVAELLTRVDDRYVIMNAGDELRLSFRAPPPAQDGWTRDFVLIGDGWEKDGDYNTSYSKTVLPLPTHARPDYQAASAEPTLADDPIYRAHADDWRRFHTRFVSPHEFLAGLVWPRSGEHR